nr:hypothetical protein BaRGS_024133 [Batillaria attramentaria]
MKVLSETDMYEDDLKLKICFRAAKWQCAWDCVVHIFALTESDKDFTNYFVNDLLQLMAHYVGNGPLYCRTFVRHLHKTGHTAFAFDLALTFGTWEEALLIVSDVEENGADFVWMLLDVASQVTSDHVTRFIDRCLQVGLSDFALALSAVLKQWSRVVEIAKSGELTSNAFTGPVFRSAIIAGCWEVVEYFLDMLTEDDIALETRYIPRTVDISPLLDQLVSHGHTPLAMKVASLYGHWNKALDILRNAPKTKVITWFARRAFEADIPTLEDFMSVGLDLELKRAMLGRPQAMTFTENQWSCVMRLVEDGCLDDHVLQWVVRKAVDEDCHCLKRLIGQGEPPVDYQLMTAILTTDLSTSLSENKWSCVEELLRKEAEEKLARKKLESSGRASCRLSVVQEGKALLGEVREEQMLDENGTVRPQSKRKSCIEPIDFTSSLEKSGNSDLENYLKDPWNRVTSTLDRMVGSSQYLMMLCERAAQEEKWLALKWLTSSHCELRENALDRIFRVKHRSSDDDESDEDDVSSTDGFLDYQYGGLDTRWTSFDFHALEAVHVICFQASHSHEDDLMQDRHKIVLLRRALQLGHWHKVEEIVSCGLFPSQRPWVYKMAAEAQKWSVALQVLDQGLEEIPARHWVHPAKSIKDLTSQETAFVERGLCNSYFTSNLFSSESGTGGGNPRQGAGCIARGADNPKTESPRKHDPAGKNAMDSVSQSTSKSRSDHTPKPGDKTSRRRLPATVLSGMKRLGGLLKPDTPTVGGKLKRKVTKISSLEKKLLKAAVKGEWALVMSVYQAGLHEDVKMQVFDEAVRQQKWHIVTTLIRRDPEASTLTHHYIQAVYDPEGCLHTELLEALVKRGIPHDERDRLAELCLMNRWWPQFLVLTQAGISGELRSKGLQEVLRRNEWTFVADYIKTDFVFDGERLIILEQALAKRIWPVVTSLVTPTIPKAKVSEIIFEAVKVGKQSVVEECMKRCAHDGRGKACGARCDCCLTWELTLTRHPPPPAPFPYWSALESDRLFVGKERDKERLSEEIVRLLIEAGASVYQASMSDNLYAMPRSKIFKPPNLASNAPRNSQRIPPSDPPRNSPWIPPSNLASNAPRNSQRIPPSILASN